MNQLELQQQIIEYFDALQTKLYQINYTNVRVHLPDDISKAFKYITCVLDQMIDLYEDLTQQYSQLELALQKSESECRNHIYIEQRFKIHCDSLQEVLSEQEKQVEASLLKIETQEKQILQLKKEVNLATKRHLNIERSVTDTSQDNQSRVSCQTIQFLVVHGVPSKQSTKVRPRLMTETIALLHNKVRSISSLEHIVNSIHMRKSEDKHKRSSTIQVSTLKRK